MRKKQQLPAGLPGKTASAWRVFERTAEIMEEEPRRVDMAHWAKRVGVTESPCGTTGCVAGWTAHVMGHNIRSRGVMEGAGDIVRDALKLDESETHTLFNPFSVTNYKNRDHDTPEHHGLSAVNHLRRFMQRYEARLRATKVRLVQGKR